MKRIGLDTNIFMSVFLEEKGKLEACLAILQNIHDGILEGIISVITLVEIAVLFYQKNEYLKAKKALSLINSLSNIAIIDITPHLALKIAAIKTSDKLSVADAIILATAVHASAEAFLTYDHDFAKVKTIRCIKPEDYLQEMNI
ncbi:MAG: putative toxin-antitoxin system toxin component, PIN family [Candidatus Schekmanbacteria bacterium]|nr:putative toxin-antitoxin system toxin component, PIN family [Candidatus Schekmanbacteria bacterium]